MKRAISSFLIFLIFNFFGCSSQVGVKSESEKEVNQVAENQDVVISNVPSDSIFFNAKANLWQSINREQDSINAILLFLDPHGAGEVPLKKYFGMANINGWAMFGSSLCKNGLSSQMGVAIIQDHVKQLRNLGFPSTIPLVLCGFSGGARLAFFAAQNPGLVDKVIYIGAGGGEINLRIPVLGFAGNQDMNFAELVEFDAGLSGDYPHFLLETNGKHEWPSENDFELAASWIDFDKSKKLFDISSLKENKNLNFAIKGNRLAFLAQLEKWSGKQGAHYQDWEKLSISRPWMELMKKRKSIQMLEMKERQRLAGLVFSQPLDDWKKVVEQLNNGSEPEIEAMNKRLLGYLSLLCYSYIQSYWPGNEAAQIIPYLIQLYQWVDPENPEGWFLQARWECRQPNPNGEILILALQSAKNKGFADWNRLDNEPEFFKAQSFSAFRSFRASLEK